jgi:predicted TIM-barrel fold metal-dependent hydrolase
LIPERSSGRPAVPSREADVAETRKRGDRNWIREGTLPGGGGIRVVDGIDAPTALSEGIRIVDCDTHFCEPHDTWTSRAPAKYKELVPRVVRKDHQDVWVMNGNIPIGPVGYSVIGKDYNKLLGKLTHPRYEDMIAASYDPVERTKVMDEMGVWAQIAYPNTGAVNGRALLQIDDLDLRLAIVSSYNDAAAEWQHQSSNRMFPQAVLPLWDRDTMVREAERAIGLGLTGFTMADRPEQFGVPNYLDDYWTPFFELVNAHQVPLNFHLASGIDGFEFVWDGYGFETAMAIGSVLFYITNAATLGNFLYSGLFDKYPNLKLVSVESGAGWIPFVLESLEHQLDEMMPNDGKKLTRRPTEYFRDHVYACFWFEKEGPTEFARKIGAKNLLFETDFPHPTSLYPGIHAQIERALGNFDPASRKAVLQDNAVSLYQLPQPV